MSFRIGQKVVYIEKSIPYLGLIKNRIYTVLSQIDCNCPSQHIDVGIPSNKTFIYCDVCGAIISLDDRWFLDHSGFRSLEDMQKAVLIAEGVLELD